MRTAELHRAAAAVVMPGFVGTELPDWVLSRLDAGMAGVWLFGHNVVDPDQVGALTAQLHLRAPHALVASDEEGGTVTRLEQREGSRWPGHAALGRVDDIDLTQQVAAELGAFAASCGVDLVAAPDADVNSAPGNPVIGVRAFGADPTVVSRHTAAFVRGLAQGGVLSCAKHFPGHGATTQDSHIDLPRVEDTREVVRGRDLPPFAAAVEAGVDVLMTGHVVYDAWAATPATITPELICLAREDLGFTGVVCTDALDMAAIDAVVGRHQGAVLALAAGVDLVCLGNPAFPRDYDAKADVDSVVQAVMTAVTRGELSAERLQQAAARVLALGQRQASRRVLADGPQRDAPVGARAADAALDVLGVVPRAWHDPLVHVPDGGTNIASGTRAAAFLRELALGWPGLRVAGEPAVAEGHGGDLVVITDDRTDPLAAEPMVRRAAVLVHLGISDPPAATPSGCVVVRTWGGGRAAAHAVAAALSPDAAAKENV